MVGSEVGVQGAEVGAFAHNLIVFAGAKDSTQVHLALEAQKPRFKHQAALVLRPLSAFAHNLIVFASP